MFVGRICRQKVSLIWQFSMAYLVTLLQWWCSSRLLLPSGIYVSQTHVIFQYIHPYFHWNCHFKIHNFVHHLKIYNSVGCGDFFFRTLNLWSYGKSMLPLVLSYPFTFCSRQHLFLLCSTTFSINCCSQDFLPLLLRLNFLVLGFSFFPFSYSMQLCLTAAVLVYCEGFLQLFLYHCPLN